METKEMCLALKRHIDSLSIVSGFNFSARDLAGLIWSNESYSSVMRPLMNHDSSYCLYVKSHRLLSARCGQQKLKCAEKCQAISKIFYGVCHAGVGEFVIPVQYDSTMVGVICLGSFRTDDKLSKAMIRRISSQYGLSEELLLTYYYQLSPSPAPPKDMIENLYIPAAHWLGQIYAAINGKAYNRLAAADRHHIIQRVVKYIDHNYRENLKVSTIADSCNCSESYINHNFKRLVGVNVKRYINKLRVEDAKLYLEKTYLSITEIGTIIGFEDTNYFTKVFTKLVKTSPSQYRQQRNKVV